MGEWGGTGLVVMGETSGGAPYGLTIEEWREASERREGGAGWARAKAAIRELAERQNPAGRVEVGWVRYLEEGAFRKAWTAELDVAPDPLGFSGPVVAFLPQGEYDASAEVRWLARLCARSLPFAVPRPLGATPDGIVVTSFVRGLPAPRDRWKDCVRVAAALHRQPFSFEGDRTAHALRTLEPLRGSTHPDVVEAVAWCEQRLPRGQLVLTHGDLRPQNLLLGLEGDVGVVEWQFVGPGDPAEELATTTLWARRPSGGPAMVQAYLDAGGVSVSVEEVVFYELCSLARRVDATAFQHEVGQLRAILRRALGSP